MKTIIAGALAIVLLVSAAPSASAQNVVIRHVYANSVAVPAAIREVERDSNSFRALYERRYHEMFAPNWRRSDDTRKAIQDLDRALEHVRYRIDSGEKARYVRDDVKTVVERARIVNRYAADPDEALSTMKGDWAQLRSEINDLAGIYDLRGV